MTVTKKQLKNLKPIKKGEIRNPLGGRAHNPVMKAFKSLTEAEMMEIGTLVLKGSLTELKAIKNNQENTSVLKAMLAGVAIRTIEKGDPTALDVLLNRLIGKVRENVHHTGLPTDFNLSVNQMTSEERLKRIAELEPIIKHASKK